MPLDIPWRERGMTAPRSFCTVQAIRLNAFVEFVVANAWPFIFRGYLAVPSGVS